jgi:hypothetical protein
VQQTEAEKRKNWERLKNDSIESFFLLINRAKKIFRGFIMSGKIYQEAPFEKFINHFFVIIANSCRRTTP